MIQYRDTRITVFESALYRTTTTVVQTPDLILLVDPNCLPVEVARIEGYLQAIRKGKPLYLLFTHSDYDHIIARGAFPEAEVIASAAFADNPGKEEILDQIRKFDDEYYIERYYPIVYPQVDLTVEKNGQELLLGNTRLCFYLAPGHNRDGVFTFVDGPDCWIAGDYLCNVEFPYIYHSSVDYDRTLDKAEAILRDHHPRILIPGHGDVTTDRQEMHRRLANARDYIQKLRTCIQQGIEFPVEELWEYYRFPLSMQAFHEANEALIRKELED